MDRVDGLLARVTSRWNADLMRLAQDEVRTVQRPSTVDTNGKRKRLPAPPPGWGDSESASRSSIVAARMLKQR